MTSADEAAWVQAIGSILTVASGFLIVWWQNRNTRLRAEADRRDRAEVVAFRLSGWLGEVSSRLLLTQEKLDIILAASAVPAPDGVANSLRIGVIAGIDGVLPDLHYLAKGSGDIAQLDFHVRFFDSTLEAAWKHWSGDMAAVQTYFDNIARQLTIMRDLCSNAERHIQPILVAACAKER